MAAILQMGFFNPFSFVKTVHVIGQAMESFLTYLMGSPLLTNFLD